LSGATISTNDNIGWNCAAIAATTSASFAGMFVAADLPMEARISMTRALAALLVGGWVAALPGGSQGGDVDTAFATLLNRQGIDVGRVTLHQTPQGLLVTVQLLGVPPGEHAIHIHERGKCEPPDFESAGEHFKPGGEPHGSKAPGGPHAGDLPNIYLPGYGPLRVEFVAPGLVLNDDSPYSLLAEDGTAVVLHAGRDDQVTQPAGDAGIRIACGVVHRR
jgi:Cu-Zn family superoxide dismutase